MRRIRFTLSCLWLFLSVACSQELAGPAGDNVRQGEIEIVLSHDAEPQTKGASEFAVPNIEDLKVEIFKKADNGLVRLYRDTYANTLGKKIPLNCADYRLLASHGDPLAAGFDKAYFEGVTDFTLSPQESEVIETLVKVSNVRVSVSYGENLRYDYPEFYSLVKSATSNGTTRSLKFYSDETRAGFVPLGQITLELYAKVDGTWKYYVSEPVQADPGDDYTFHLETQRLDSQVNFNVTLMQPDEQPKNMTLTSDIYPAETPSLNVNGFGNSLLVTEGDQPVEDLKIDMVADGEIDQCLLSVDSDYLSALGVPAEVDLADIQMDQAVAEALKSVGLRWMTSMKGRKYAYVDFSGVTKYLSSIQCDLDNMFEATFSLNLIDARNGVEGSTHNGTVQSDAMTFIQGVPAPKISVEGFDQGPIEVMEAVETSSKDLRVHLQAKGRIAKCLVSIQSPYLQAIGIPASVDLASLDASTEQLLRSVGLDWSEELAGSISAEVDFSGVVDYMENSNYSSAKGQSFASFSVAVENSIFREGNIKDTSAEIGQFTYIIPAAPSATDNYADIDVRARRLDNYSTVLCDGNFNVWAMQCSPDNGNTWINMPASLNGSALHCAQVTGLSSTATAGVTHTVRAIYNNNPDITYPLSSFTTEAAAQVPNSDFNSWHALDFQYWLTKIQYKFLFWNITFGNEYASRKWYLPWTNYSNKCWDVNSRKTMPSETSPNFENKQIGIFTGDTQAYKVFPTVSYSTDTPDGSAASAQMVGVFVCNMATSSSYGDGIGGTLGDLLSDVTKSQAAAAGEIFIGTAKDNGTHDKEGCSFTSRPDKLRFMYKYAPVNSETYMVTVKLTDEEENVIAQAETTSGAASSTWTESTLDLTYDPEFKDVRPSKIYIAFRSASCADSEIGYEQNKQIEMAGSNFRGHLGSVLKIDNVELIYQ